MQERILFFDPFSRVLKWSFCLLDCNHLYLIMLKAPYCKPFKITYASLKLGHYGYFADDSVKKIVYRSIYVGKGIIASFILLRESADCKLSHLPPKGKTAHNLSGSKDRKRRKADLESREGPRRRCKRKLFSRVSQA